MSEPSLCSTGCGRRAVFWDEVLDLGFCLTDYDKWRAMEEWDYREGPRRASAQTVRDGDGEVPDAERSAEPRPGRSPTAIDAGTADDPQ